MNSRGDLLKCQEPTCDEIVRIYNPWCGLWVKFRCAKCLKHKTFDTVPKIGCYTQCVDCTGQFKVMVSGCNQCFVCKPDPEPEPYTPPIDPKTPSNYPKPDICPNCRENYDCEWTHDRYSLGIHNEYYYSWFCQVCLTNQLEDI